MIKQYLLQTNESVTVAKSKTISHLNMAQHHDRVDMEAHGSWLIIYYGAAPGHACNIVAYWRVECVYGIVWHSSTSLVKLFFKKITS